MRGRECCSESGSDALLMKDLPVEGLQPSRRCRCGRADRPCLSASLHLQPARNRSEKTTTVTAKFLACSRLSDLSREICKNLISMSRRDFLRSQTTEFWSKKNYPQISL